MNACPVSGLVRQCEKLPDARRYEVLVWIIVTAYNSEGGTTCLVCLFCHCARCMYIYSCNHKCGAWRVTFMRVVQRDAFPARFFVWTHTYLSATVFMRDCVCYTIHYIFEHSACIVAMTCLTVLCKVYRQEGRGDLISPVTYPLPVQVPSVSRCTHQYILWLIDNKTTRSINAVYILFVANSTSHFG